MSTLSPQVWETAFRKLPHEDQTTLTKARTYRRNLESFISDRANDHLAGANLHGYRLCLLNGARFAARDALDFVINAVKKIENARPTWTGTQAEHLDGFLDACLSVIETYDIASPQCGESLSSLGNLLDLLWRLETCRHTAKFSQETLLQDESNLLQLYEHALRSLAFVVRGANISAADTPSLDEMILGLPGMSSKKKVKPTKKPKKTTKSAAKFTSLTTPPPPLPYHPSQRAWPAVHPVDFTSNGNLSTEAVALQWLLLQINECVCRVPKMEEHTVDCCCSVSSPALLHHPSHDKQESFVDAEKDFMATLKRWMTGDGGYDNAKLLTSGQHESTSDTTLHWLYKSQAFRSWAYHSDSAIMHMHGPVGIGKTHAALALARDWQARYSPTGYVGHFFCQSLLGRTKKPTAENVLSNILFSLVVLAEQSPKVHRAAVTYCRPRPRFNAEQRARVSDCVNIMLEMLESNPIILVIDAIDLLDVQQETILIRALQLLVSRAKNIVKVFVTSRGSVQTRDAMFGAIELLLTQHLLSPDVEKYAHEHLKQVLADDKSVTASIDESQLLQLSKTLAANSTFGQVKMELLLWRHDPDHSIDGLTSRSSLTTFELLYKKVYGRILAQEARSRETAIATIQWVYHGRINFNINTLVRAVSLTTGYTDTTVDDLTTACRGLIDLSSDDGIPCLSHSSARDYLRQQHLLSCGASHRRLAMVCLSLCSSWDTQSDMDELQAYAVKAWTRHCRVSERYHCQELNRELTRLLKQEFDTLQPSSWTNIARPGLTSPILVVSSLGLLSLLETWQWSPEDLKATTTEGETALHVACKSGHTSTASYLIQLGCAVDAKSHRTGQTPLNYALTAGHVEVCRLLLEHSATLSWNSPSTLDAFQEACGQRVEEVALLILGHTPKDGLAGVLEQLWLGALDADSVTVLQAVIDYTAPMKPSPHHPRAVYLAPQPGSSLLPLQDLSIEQCVDFLQSGASNGHLASTEWLLQALHLTGQHDVLNRVVACSLNSGYQFLLFCGHPTFGQGPALHGPSISNTRRILALAKSQENSDMMEKLLAWSARGYNFYDQQNLFYTAIHQGDLATAEMLRDSGAYFYSQTCENAFSVALCSSTPETLLGTLNLYSQHNVDVLGHDQSNSVQQSGHLYQCRNMGRYEDYCQNITSKTGKRTQALKDVPEYSYIPLARDGRMHPDRQPFALKEVVTAMRKWPRDHQDKDTKQARRSGRYEVQDDELTAIINSCIIPQTSAEDRPTDPIDLDALLGTSSKKCPPRGRTNKPLRLSRASSTTTSRSSSRSTSSEPDMSRWHDPLDEMIRDMDRLVSDKNSLPQYDGLLDLVSLSDPSATTHWLDDFCISHRNDDFPSTPETVAVTDAFDVVFAAAMNYHRMLDVMLSHRDVFGLTDKLLRLALCEAVRADHLESVCVLLAKGDIAQRDVCSAFIIAAEKDHVHIIDELLRSQLPGMSLVNCIWNLLLSSQSEQSSTFKKVQQLMLEKSSEIPASFLLDTLPAAAEIESSHVVKHILDNVDDISLEALEAAFDKACMNRRTSTISLLLDRLATMTDVAEIVYAKLEQLAKTITADCFMCLLSVYPMSVSNLAEDVLHQAIVFEDRQTVQTIVDGRAAGTGIDKKVLQKALCHASRLGSLSICSILLAAGLDVNDSPQTTSKAELPIELALDGLAGCLEQSRHQQSRQFNDVAEKLFQSGAKLNSDKAKTYMKQTITVATPTVIRALLSFQTSVRLSDILLALRRKTHVNGVFALLLRKCKDVTSSSVCWEIILKAATGLLYELTYSKLSCTLIKRKTDEDDQIDDLPNAKIKEGLLIVAIYCIWKAGEYEADDNSSDMTDDSSVCTTEENHIETVELIYDQTGETEVTMNADDYGVLLMQAVRLKEDDTITLLLKQDSIDVDWRDPHGVTALHLASERGYKSICRRLLRAGAVLNARDRARRTPLSVATKARHSSIVNILKKYGAVAEVQSEDEGSKVNGFEAVRAAIKARETNTLEKLLSSETDPKSLAAIMIYACARGKSSLLQKALKAGADVNYIMKDPIDGFMNISALHASIESRSSMFTISDLLAHGADPTLEFGALGDPLTLAIRRRQTNAVSLLLSSSCEDSDNFDPIANILCKPTGDKLIPRWTYPARIARSASIEASRPGTLHYVGDLVRSAITPQHNGPSLAEVFNLANEMQEPAILRAWLKALAKRGLLSREICELPTSLPRDCESLLRAWLEYVPCSPQLFLEACVRGYEAIVKTGLRDVSASVQVDGCPALHLAAAHGRLSIVKLLVQHGALEDKRGGVCGKTPRNGWENSTFGSPLRTAIEGCILPKLIKMRLIDDEGKEYASKLARQPWTKIMPLKGPLLSYNHIKNATEIVEFLFASGLHDDRSVGPLGDVHSMLKETKLEQYFQKFLERRRVVDEVMQSLSELAKQLRGFQSLPLSASANLPEVEAIDTHDTAKDESWPRHEPFQLLESNAKVTTGWNHPELRTTAEPVQIDSETSSFVDLREATPPETVVVESEDEAEGF